MSAWCLALLLACGAMAARAQATPEAAFPALGDGAIVLFRHALAPGVGDPAGFRLNDCPTQRNLNDTGRAQARRIGERFRAQGVKVGAVLSSQWCRTRETADLAFPGQRRDDPDFNSFFGQTSPASAQQTARALSTLARWRGPGVLVVVTHQVNISALTGGGASSAEGIVIRVVPGADRVEVLAQVPP